jgi:hypothetical protein
MSGPGKQYVVGKGRLYFDKFVNGSKTSTGRRYLGNSPELSMSQAQETLDHFDADEGLNVKDESITITNDMTITFKLDSIEMENAALWFGGDTGKATIVAALAVVNPDIVVNQARSYQIGVDEDSPNGTRNITNVLISTVVPAVIPTDPPVVTAIAPADYPGNFEIDLERATVYVEMGAPDVADGTKLRITYDQEGFARTIVIAKGQEIRGEVFFASKNPVGDQKDFLWPYVKLTSNGDYALKGDTWQEMSFTGEVLKRDATTERLYIEGITPTVI